jgi:hypothetical protein
VRLAAPRNAETIALQIDKKPGGNSGHRDLEAEQVSTLVPSGKLLDELAIEHNESLTSIAFTLDGRTLAAGHFGKITLWDRVPQVAALPRSTATRTGSISWHFLPTARR